MSSSSTTPIDAPVLTNCVAAGIGAMPPSPRASPAARYSGIGDSAYRRATVLKMVSTVRMTPSSSSSVADTRLGSAFGRRAGQITPSDYRFDAADAVFGADDH